jgi:hypothetical protein
MKSGRVLLSSSERRGDELVERLILDVKALVLLQGSEAELKAKLEKKLVGSHDESVLRFVRALQTGSKPNTGRLLFVALGELVMASLLVLLGTMALVPTLTGVNTPAGLVQFFAEHFYGTLANTPLSPYLSVIEFAMGALLMLSAFYTLRLAAINLKEVGLTIRTGEA